MWPSRRELVEITQEIGRLEARMRMVEEESKTTKAIRQARADRRDFWIVKLIP